MHALRGRYRRSKKASSNPYAGRGLDKFALVSAELEAKRERLAAQLGTPLSAVRFAIGSHRTWIPIIISSSSMTEIQSLRRAAEALISEDQPALDAGIIGDKPALGGLISEGKTHLGGLKSDLGENIVTNPEGEHKAANEGGESKVYQREKMGFLTAATAGALWVAKAVVLGIKMAAIMASNVVMLHWHAKAMVKSLPSAQRANLPKEESGTIAHSSAATPTPSSSSFAFSQSGMASSSSSLQTSLLPFPSSPAPVRIKSKNALSDQVAREGSPHVEAISRQHDRFVVKGSSKIFPAPSTPQDSRQPTKPFSTAGARPKTPGFYDQAAHMEIEEDRLVQKVNSHKLLRSSSMVREMASEKVKKERSEKLGRALSAAGLILGLSGLVIGYVPAILGVVCWWYVLPSLRKAVGDKPSVRSHHRHHSHNNSNNTNILHTTPKAKRSSQLLVVASMT